MSNLQLLKRIEELITPHLFMWHDAMYMSDGKLESRDYLTTFLCGYKFIKTASSFTVLRINLKQKVNQHDVYLDVSNMSEELLRCVKAIESYDFTRLDEFEKERLSNNIRLGGSKGDIFYLGSKVIGESGDSAE